jgi:hypothetical protein
MIPVMQPKFILIGTLVIMTAFAAFLVWPKAPAGEFMPVTQGDRAIAAAVAELKTKLPSLVDEETALVDAIAGQNSVTFIHRLTRMRASEIDPEQARRILEPIVRDGACASSELALYRDLGATLRYAYYDINGVLVVHFDLDTKTCQPTAE